MANKHYTLKDLEIDFKLTPEEEAAIQFEMDLIQATIDARKKSQLTQRELSEKSGIKQSCIAKLESRARSPQVYTLLKLLVAMGYTLRVVPLENKKK